MNEKFRMELNEQLRDVKWSMEDTERVLESVRGRRKMPVRTALVLAAALAILLALACVGYAEYSGESSLLSALFGGRAIRQEAAELLIFEPVTITKDGITAAITEYLYDGQTIYMTGEMRNDTDRPLLCGMREKRGGSGGGVFALGSHLVILQPGETASGQFEVSDMNLLKEAAYFWRIEVEAVALRPTGAVTPDVNDTGYYSWYRHYGTELTEEVFSETLAFPMKKNMHRPSRTAPGAKEIRMEEYGYTLVMRTANFAAASSSVEFIVVPDEPRDILAYGDEGSDKRERLYRWYQILVPGENGEMEKLLMDGTFGWEADQTRLAYSFIGDPVSSVPEKIVLVPLDADGEKLMDEAVEIPVR